MASFERLYIPHDPTVSNKVLLASKRYCVVKRRLQVHASIGINRIVCPSWLAGGRLKGCPRLEPDLFRPSISFECREVVVESEWWVRYAELAGGVLA